MSNTVPEKRNRMKRRKKNRVQKFLLCLLIGVCVAGMNVEGKAAESDIAEVEAFVTAFYEAQKT